MRFFLRRDGKDGSEYPPKPTADRKWLPQTGSGDRDKALFQLSTKKLIPVLLIFNLIDSNNKTQQE